MHDRELNKGVCPKCHTIVPVTHVEKDGKMYLAHHCERCGQILSLISSNAERWRFKRDFCSYNETEERNCDLHCLNCNHGKTPTLIFLDVTNRCNMNCPICLANIKAMGFRFDPPMEYFDKVFKYLTTFKPRPKIELFGGEPTCREDLIDIIDLAASYGLAARIVTNGIKFADEEYCKEMLATGTQLMFSFDGRDVEIYKKLRNNPGAYYLKVKALETIKKHYRSKLTIMCCVGVNVNEHVMADLIDYAHENRDFIAALDLIPLTETWGPAEIDAGDTTIEDVERIMREAVPGMDFVPSATLYRFKTLAHYFNLGRITFGGSHPNCESVTILVSDGARYRPIGDYLKHSFEEVIGGALKMDKEMGNTLDRRITTKIFGKKAAVALSYLRFIYKNVNLKMIFGKNAPLKIVKFLWGLARGKEPKVLFRTYTRCHTILRVIILPFEEPPCVESKRLVECPASFAYEHPETGEIQLMPVCAWTIYKDQILRATTEKYGVMSTVSGNQT